MKKVIKYKPKRKKIDLAAWAAAKRANRRGKVLAMLVIYEADDGRVAYALSEVDVGFAVLGAIEAARTSIAARLVENTVETE